MSVRKPLTLQLQVRVSHVVHTIDVQLDDWCEACTSTGVVQSEEWATWLRRYEHEEARLKGEHGGRWYAELTDETYVALQLRGWMEPTGPEELACGECEGAGFRPTEIGSTILGLVTRYHHPAVAA
jgi:hypothetical protein